MRKLLLLTVMCVLGLSVNLRAQEAASDTITIGSGSAYSINVPSNTYSYYSISQQIFLADDMQGKTGDIKSLAFMCTRDLGAVTRNFEIYMVNTDKDVFGGTTSWIDVKASDLVFSGNVAYAPKDQWTMIDFDKPFAYQEGKNVILCINDVTGADAGSLVMKYASEEKEFNRCLYVSGYNPYDATNITDAGTLNNNVNQVKFVFGEGGIGVEELASSLGVYPNPVENTLFIDVEAEIETVSVYTLTGAMVRSEKYNNGINVSDLSSGVYFIKVKTANDEFTTRFVKK